MAGRQRWQTRDKDLGAALGHVGVIWREMETAPVNRWATTEPEAQSTAAQDEINLETTTTSEIKKENKTTELLPKLREGKS